MKEIIYSELAKKQIKKIALSDKKLALRILQKIEDYASGIKKKYDIKLLKGDFGNFKRLRIGDYRVIFEESYNIITIYEINHRGSAYK
jgi:mRNA interferase RelE/StbE